jgi:hypothetical protein
MLADARLGANRVRRHPARRAGRPAGDVVADGNEAGHRGDDVHETSPFAHRSATSIALWSLPLAGRTVLDTVENPRVST